MLGFCISIQDKRASPILTAKGQGHILGDSGLHLLAIFQWDDLASVQFLMGSCSDKQKGRKISEFYLRLDILFLIHRLQMQRVELITYPSSQHIANSGPFFLLFASSPTPHYCSSPVLICLTFNFVYGYPCCFIAFLSYF